MRRGKRCARRTVRTFELFTHHTQGEKQCFNICIICLTKQRSDSIKNINYFQTNYFNNFKIWVSPEDLSNPFRKKWTDCFYYKKKKAHGQRQTVTRSPGHLLDNSNTLESPCKKITRSVETCKQFIIVGVTSMRPGNTSHFTTMLLTPGKKSQRTAC